MDQPENSKNKPEKLLTGIRDAYTLAATHEIGEVDSLMIKQFLDTLAEVALAVASRTVK